MNYQCLLGVGFTKKIMTNLCYQTQRQKIEKKKHDLLGSNGSEGKPEPSDRDIRTHSVDNSIWFSER